MYYWCNNKKGVSLRVGGGHCRVPVRISGLDGSGEGGDVIVFQLITLKNLAEDQFLKAIICPYSYDLVDNLM